MNKSSRPIAVNADTGAIGSPNEIPKFSTTSCRDSAPTSMNIWSMVITCRRCASGRKCGGRDATTPSTFSPPRVKISTRCDSKLCSHHPPIPRNWMNPSGVMFCTMNPTSSMCPATSTRGPSSPVSQNTEPFRSAESSPHSCSSSTKIALTSSSCPETE